MKSIKFILFSALVVIITSCSTEKEAVLPDNVIQDSEGLVINLEWSTGGSATKAQGDADLELYLYKGESEISSSTSSYSFEEVRINNIYSDGSYLIKVEYYSGGMPLTYTLYLRGGSQSESTSYNGSFYANDEGLVIEYLKIIKTGEKYEVIDL